MVFKLNSWPLLTPVGYAEGGVGDGVEADVALAGDDVALDGEDEVLGLGGRVVVRDGDEALPGGLRVLDRDALVDGVAHEGGDLVVDVKNLD